MYLNSTQTQLQKLAMREAQDRASLTSADFLTTNQVARLLGISPSSLEKARSSGRGPYAQLAYHKLGRLVRYSRADIENFLKTQRIAGVNRL